MLAWLEGADPARERVDSAMAGGQALMSWISAGEVAYVVERIAGADNAQAVIDELRGRVLLELPGQERVLAAARIKAHHPMAYADAFACATAIAHDAVLLTGDPEILAARDLDLAVLDLRSPATNP